MLVRSLHCVSYVLAHMTFLNLNILLSDWLLELYILSWRLVPSTNSTATINAHRTGSKSNNKLKQSCLLVLVLIKVIILYLPSVLQSFEPCCCAVIVWSFVLYIELKCEIDDWWKTE